MSLICKSNFSGSECRIFRGKVITGLLKTRVWKNEAHGELDGTMVKITSRGFWKKVTEITGIEGGAILGVIEVSFLKGKARIFYQDLEYHWKFESWTMQSWKVSKGEDSATYKGTSIWKNEGELVNEGIPSAVLLAALYVQGYFRTMSA